MKAGITRVLLGVVALAVLSGARALAQDDLEARLRSMEERLRAQDEEIGRLRDALSRQQAAGDSLEEEIERLLSRADEGPAPGDPKRLIFTAGSGTKGESGDREFKFQVGGRIMWDQTWVDGDSKAEASYGAFENVVEPRRARIFLAGEMYGNVQWKAEYDLAGGDADLKDVYVALVAGSFGTWTFGHHKEPFGLEEQTSSKYLTFLERALPIAFSPGRNVGLSWQGSYLDGNLFPALGIFHGTNDQGVGLAGKDVTARIAGTPLRQEETLLHLGLGLSRRDPTTGTGRIRERPEIHTTHRVVDTGTFDVDSELLLGLEAALVHGPFSVQSEYSRAGFDSKGGEDPAFHGYYVHASWFVTGEHRPYEDGAFGRVKPLADFDGEGGTGAVELGIRYSRIDLNDSAVRGGEASDWTFGLNWTLNPNTRVMLNYVLSDAEGGEVRGFLIRVQIDF